MAYTTMTEVFTRLVTQQDKDRRGILRIVIAGQETWLGTGEMLFDVWLLAVQDSRSDVICERSTWHAMQVRASVAQKPENKEETDADLACSRGPVACGCTL